MNTLEFAFTRWFVALIVSVSVACSSAGEAPEGACLRSTSLGDYSDPQDTTDDHAQDRRACKFGTGHRTNETIGASAKSAGAVKHIIVAMLENRSFDHYLSDLSAVGVTDVNLPDPDVTNPDGKGGAVRRERAATYCIPNEVSHEWGDAHLQLNNGKMDGFVATSTPNAMAFYDSSDLPVLYALASQFTLSDRHFGSLLGPTWPNRLFLYAATTCGYAEGGDTNLAITFSCGLTQPNILDRLRDAQKTYRFYDQSGPAAVSAGLGISGIPADYSNLEDDLTTGNLPDVAFVGASTGALKPPWAAIQDDDHPAANVLLGEVFLYELVETLVAHPAVWAQTVLFITYDEHGGFYDHVRPPAACPPTDDEPVRDYKFDQYGFRVPLIIVSPFAHRHFVTHADTDHTSITRFIEHWIGAGALTSRDANAWPFLDAFDFDRPDTTPPLLTAPPGADGSSVSCMRSP